MLAGENVGEALAPDHGRLNRGRTESEDICGDEADEDTPGSGVCHTPPGRP